MLWKVFQAYTKFDIDENTIEPVDPDDLTKPSRTADYYLISLSPQNIDTVRVSKADLPKFQKYLNQK